MLGRYLSLVKFSHTVFALPFALVGLTLAFWQGGAFEWYKLAFVIGCMVTARNSAMGFNRWADRRIDADNPRTAIRDIPAGKVSAKGALAFVIINCLAFIVLTWFINPLAFYLSPVALAVVLGYSYTKRFTALCHLILGAGLGLAPVGAYIAVTEAFAPAPIVLGVAVLCWTAGFDIIYALQDADFDVERGLSSIPAALGRQRALRVSEGLHFVCSLLLAAFVWLSGGGPLMAAGWLLFSGLLIYQHRIVSADDLSRVNIAFFTTNGLGSIGFGVLVIADMLLLWHLADYPSLATLAGI